MNAFLECLAFFKKDSVSSFHKENRPNLPFFGSAFTKPTIPSVLLFKDKEKCVPFSDNLLDKCHKIYGGTQHNNKDEVQAIVAEHANNCDASIIFVFFPKPARNLSILVGALEIILLDFQLRIKLVYSTPSSDRNEPVILQEDKEQEETTTLLALSLLKIIYAFSFNQVANTYYFKRNPKYRRWYLRKIRKTLLKVWKFIFLVHPSLMKYMNKVLDYKMQSSGSESMQKHLKTFMESLGHCKRNWILCKKLFIRYTEPSDPHINKYDHVNSIRQNEQYANLWIRYKNLYTKLFEMFDDSDIISNLKTCKILVDCLETSASDLLNEFKQIANERKRSASSIMSSFRENQPEAEISRFISDCIENLKKFHLFGLLVGKYAQHLKIFDNEEQEFSAMFWNSMLISIKQITEYKDAKIWNAGYLSYDPYVWETAMLIENDPESGSKVAEYLVRQLESETSPLCGRFINKYCQAFPGLLKSICDRVFERWSSTSQSLNIYEIIQRILNQDGKVKDLMDLYFALRQAEERNPETKFAAADYFIVQLEYYNSFLLKKLKEKNIKSIKDITKKKNKQCIIIMYALQILGFSKSAFTNDEFAAKFQRSKYIAMKLKSRLITLSEIENIIQ